MLLKSVYKTLAAGANYMYWKAGAEGIYLLGVNLEENDSGGTIPQVDGASIFIQDPAGQGALSLAHGGLVNGQISGYGCLPLTPITEVVAVLWHATAGSIGKLNVMVGTREELGENITPGWNPRQVANDIKHYGPLTAQLVSGTGTDTWVDIRPPLGMIWEIVELWYWHDDAGNDRTTTLSYRNGSTNYSRQSWTNLSPSVKVPFSIEATGYPVLGAPVTIDYQTYIRIQAAVMTAGKHHFANVVYREYTE